MAIQMPEEGVPFRTEQLANQKNSAAASRQNAYFLFL
jgi:hypothetical protein